MDYQSAWFWQEVRRLPLDSAENICAAWEWVTSPVVVLNAFPHDLAQARSDIQLAAAERGLGIPGRTAPGPDDDPAAL